MSINGPGFGFKEPPLLSFFDSCDKGFGAGGYPVMGPVSPLTDGTNVAAGAVGGLPITSNNLPVNAGGVGGIQVSTPDGQQVTTQDGDPIIVGGIGVMNIMLVSVTERTREIGLRKALGATQKSIMMQFIIEAVLLCILGGILGIIIATSLLFLFTSINDWVFSMPFSAIIGSITFSALVGLFFGIWPAKRAAKLDPAVSLRYE